ncbi:MAG: DUF2868 domain-containing protein, partial [Pseudomonadota bacterium]|nr:DUF2868 domain-containing protein [Pseudomonadota bacterium]
HDQSPAFLHRRDRRFALDCEARGQRPSIDRWLAHMERLSGPGGDPARVQTPIRQWRRLGTGFAVAGALFGGFTMAGLLVYDGGSRINVTLLIAFVALQLLLAIFTTVQSLAGWQPWRWLLARLNRESASDTLSQLQPVLMARAAHTGGVAFALAGLVTLWVLLTIQDLAFGWSTTFDTGSGAYHTLISAIASPWQTFWPAAVPTAELVEATRFFRAQPGGASATPVEWGQWWPFVVMLWSVWALLPRLLLLALSHWLVNRRALGLLARHPDRQALLYRMETPTLDTGNQHNDAGDLPDTRTRSAIKPLSPSDDVVCWAGAGDPELPAALASASTRVYRAGGRASLADDEQVLSQLAQTLPDQPYRTVILVTRQWEPPTGELADFLEQAHSLWPAGTTVDLLPLGQPGAPADASHTLQPWLRFAERLPAGFAAVAGLPEEPGNPWQRADSFESQEGRAR